MVFSQHSQLLLWVQLRCLLSRKLLEANDILTLCRVGNGRGCLHGRHGNQEGSQRNSDIVGGAQTRNKLAQIDDRAHCYAFQERLMPRILML